ncbi:MAG: UvrD-helicase domain-containing protein, partial [Sphingomonadaceae bacterium]
MNRRWAPWPKLGEEQRRASDPADHAALSASAGTGKTHVLSSRVLRLLLSGADPGSILCLTFTKAAAAEMAGRIHDRLAQWVRLKDESLACDLVALGMSPGPEMRARARTLFAELLDATAGGLRVETIHAFAQGLLGSFPSEAGLAPGFRPIEEREEQMLARQTLAELLVAAEREGDRRLVADVQALSLGMGEQGAEAYLMRCARAPEALEALGLGEAIEPKLREAFGVPGGDIEAAIAEECGDDMFDVEALDNIARANAAWDTKTGLACAEAIDGWRGLPPEERAGRLDDIALTVLTKQGEPRKIGAGLLKADPQYGAYQARLIECCRRLLDLRKGAELAASLAAGLRAGQAFARAYGEAKRAQGLVDFDDLIRLARELLETPGMGEWVRYKLDQRTDHILVDEAQDTNAAQWSIVKALAGEYFAGEGAVRRHRTIFTVGDFKQAIFGFQGTDPRAFDEARRYFAARVAALEGRGADFLDLEIGLNFRSSPPILDLVDRLIGEIGPAALGRPQPPGPHVAHHAERPGSVTLWPPFHEASAAGEEEEPGEEDWIGEAERRYAACLARQIADWIDNPFTIGKGSDSRALRPEDILVLLRSRGALASLIVARLHAEGVPVAGIDRLLLSAPLAVQDLIAAARFAVQPLDDLNLAALLVSPLFGWSQERLFEAAHGREGRLWRALREGRGDEATLAGLRSLLDMADYAGPHLFFETILSGPLDGRRRLARRLGPEARDPLGELLASALEFETRGAPSLERFLDWFGKGEVWVQRDPSTPRDAVRVMTVHGAKGLQAPVVILADAAADPTRKRSRDALLPLAGGKVEVPIPRPKKDDLVEPLTTLIAAQDEREREEHWRLLYVALTRAEERLFVGGALKSIDKGAAPEASWHRALHATMQGMGARREEMKPWGSSLVHGDPFLPHAQAKRRAEPRP